MNGAWSSETAQELLAAALQRYAACASYDDRGLRVVEYRGEGAAPMEARFPFTTAFARPDRFRFEWGERAPDAERGREVVVLAKDQVSSWPLGASGPWECTSLAGALAEDAGGAAPVVASLLLPELFADGPRLGAAGAAAPARERLDGVECWRLELTLADARQTAWFAVDSLLLRRLEERRELGGVAILATTTYDARFGAELGDAAFTLAPPAAERLEVGWIGRGGPLSVVAFLVAALALAAGMVLLRRRRNSTDEGRPA